ncbi:linear amide C-N hydrolase [bacterium]|nr:linear amide C-N hydrolase [bacterium]
MPKSGNFILAAFAVIFSLAAISDACSTLGFSKETGYLVAKSYDWGQGHGTAVTNLSGMEKTGLKYWKDDQPAKWKSRFGSLTFNQHGREFPLGGMNEAGLVVEIMWLPETKAPDLDQRDSVNELEWIQYQLDQFETTEQVRQASSKFRLSRVFATVHYMVCDKGGDCASFEYLPDDQGKGKLEVLNAGPGSPAALTNRPYTQMLSAWKQWNPQNALPFGEGSEARFIRGSTFIENFDPAKMDPIDHAFAALQSVGGTSLSKFHIVYEPLTGVVHFRTLGFRDIKVVDLKKLDLVCSRAQEKSKFLEMNQAGAGDASGRFFAYTEKANEDLVRAGLSPLLWVLPKSTLSLLADHPKDQVCTNR